MTNQPTKKMYMSENINSLVIYLKQKGKLCLCVTTVFMEEKHEFCNISMWNFSYKGLKIIVENKLQPVKARNGHAKCAFHSAIYLF